MGLFKKATSGGDTYERNLRTKTSPADVIMWSGSKDSQTSYVDPQFGDEPHFMMPEPYFQSMDESAFQRPSILHRDMYGRVLV